MQYLKRERKEYDARSGHRVRQDWRCADMVGADPEISGGEALKLVDDDILSILFLFFLEFELPPKRHRFTKAWQL